MSAEEQKYAHIIIDDIRDGKLQVDDRTLREYIAEYKSNAENQAIVDFADTYGLDETILYKIYHINGNHDMEVSKLLDTCNKEAVEAAFNCKWFLARQPFRLILVASVPNRSSFNIWRRLIPVVCKSPINSCCGSIAKWTVASPAPECNC